MSDTPAPLSRPFRENEAVDEPRRRPLALELGIAGAAVAVAAVLAMRWLDDTSARDQVQVLQTLPQSDAAKTATTSAVAYPFGKDGPASPEATPPTEPARPTAAAARPTARSVPPGITPQQWHAVVAELSAKPDGAREIARLDKYLRFADTVRQFRDLNRTAAASEPTPALIALARQIDADLDAHIAQRELSGSEAYDIKATLLEVLEPDADTADDKLERWARTLPGERTDNDRVAMQRDAEFERRRTALVQAWSAQPPSLRDPKALERDIQSLRQQIYGTHAR